MVYVFFRGQGCWFCTDPEPYIASEIYLANGVFCLTNEDEIYLKHTSHIHSVKETITGKIYSNITVLLPSDHKDDEFTRITKSNPLHNPSLGINTLADEINNCYFKIIENSDNTFVIVNEVIKKNTSDVELLDKNIYQSDQLKILNEASKKWWSNADPEEKDTHPKNEIVTNWLKDQGFSKISATQGASIIRPDWATKGRR